MHITPLAGLRFSFNTVAVMIPLASSTINYSLFTINYQLICCPFRAFDIFYG
ncbi:MAG: hypothetical protein LBU34_08900 [Planctomycetaceae bacterium]|nr:hypothetical protein [Planctomycetaceae bacterium]